MQYISTRGGISPIPFTEAVMMGLAEDGGLLLPRTIPRIGSETYASWQDLSYPELAFEVMSRFIDDIPNSDLRELINRSYATFDHAEVTPLIHQGTLHILELFHGPTFAFKDVALQFLGNLFEYLLKKNDAVMNIIGATSGDTGSAAIYGVRGKEKINIFILHPHKRVSPVQEQQMTTVTDANVFNIAIRGTFDDGQAIVKAIFNDIDFKKKYSLGAINSINWARVLAQVVYYVHSCLHINRHEQDKAVDFAVPTGNFGDIFAGYIAKRMLPEGTIRKLLLASNTNDILTRFVTRGDYSLGEVVATSSPSMDIQAASNFERYLYYLMDENPFRTKDTMLHFAETGKLDLSSSCDQIRRDFVATAASEQEVLDTIQLFYTEHGYILDPHTAVGVHAALIHQQKGIPIICLSTAHPAKFGETVEKAIGVPLALPKAIADLADKKNRCELMDADRNLIQEFIRQHALQH
ncbi:MAG: threonine synthase [Proteobacteria bacterium]|jgi:threonine synthase|nr:threonine synthase [Desulfocapsa sp.]MBU3943423.1 threonine synthase [Pseudomonadota bacterium]MCG2743920.1 threonine synthase [Desulfobacteraceae bacterium]MBU4030429.1 threonine synthase [Pseudomonadota bacterium]MBU4043996.1 threonine synthase [Pseudomonadota bacterium]